MAVSRTASCFPTYFILSFCLVAGRSPKYALKGGTVNLSPTIAGLPDDILWKHNGNKVVEFDGAEEQVYGTYEHRVTLDWISADLNITGLRFEDSGEYELEVFVNKHLAVSRYSLKVIDKVAKPTISCNMKDGSTSDASARLVCSAEPSESQSEIKLEWSSSGKVQPGPQLTIPLGEERDDEVYTCSVSNPLSSETATFTAKDCYPVANSSAPVIASLVTIIFIILLGFAVWFCKRNKKACFAEDLEKQSPPGATEEERTPLSREPTFPSTQRLDHVRNHKEHTDADDENAQVEDETPRKGFVQDRRKMFELSPAEKEEKTHDRAPTLPSKQRLDKVNKSMTPNDHARNHKEHTDSDNENEKNHHRDKDSEPLLCSPRDDPPSHLDQSIDKGDADADQLRGPAEDKVPQIENETAPGLLPDCSKDLMSEPESSTAAEESELGKEAVEDKEARSPPANDPSPTVCPSPLTLNSPNVELKDTADEHKEDTNSGQVNGETADENVGEKDSSGLEERDESEKSSKDKQSSSVFEQKGPETQHEQGPDLSQEETNTSQENRQETEKTVPAGENESKSLGDHEEVGEEQDLYSDDPLQPQSPTPAKADNSNTAQEDPDREEEGKTSASENKGLMSASPHDEAAEKAQDGEAMRQKDSVRDAVKRIEENNRKQPSAVKLRAGQLRGPAEDEVPLSENETGPAGLLPDCSKNLMSEPESSTAAEEPESEQEPVEDDKGPSVPASPETSLTAQANSPLNKGSPNVLPKDTTVEESDSDQLTGETVRESDSPGVH